MKKLTAILLAVLTLVSCTNTGTTDDIAGIREIAGEKTDAAETEVPYADGILAPDYRVSGGKYYFTVSRRVTVPSGSGSTTMTNTMLAYTDPVSGNAAYVCSDPLCSHVTEEECRYANLRECCFTDTPGVFYGFRDSGFMKRSIWLADLNKGTSRMVCETGWMASAVGFENGTLYFRETEEITQDRQTKIICTYYALDHVSGETAKLGRTPGDWPYSKKYAEFIYNGELYFLTDGKAVRTDLRFETVTEIAELPAPVIQWHLDRNTGELYLLSGSRADFSGSLYVLRGGDLTEISPAQEEICSFGITEDRIYYTVYAPVYYGTSNLDQLMENPKKVHRTYDYTGGKLYAVSRDLPSEEAVLVYEADAADLNRMAYLTEFAVVDDFLYYREVDLVREVINGVESVTISHPGAAQIRVNLTDGSVKRIEFE